MPKRLTNRARWKRNRGFGSSADVHASTADVAQSSALDKAKDAIDHAAHGNCGAAFEALTAAVYHRGWEAANRHAAKQRGGAGSTGIVANAESQFKRYCVVKR